MSVIRPERTNRQRRPVLVVPRQRVGGRPIGAPAPPTSTRPDPQTAVPVRSRFVAAWSIHLGLVGLTALTTGLAAGLAGSVALTAAGLLALSRARDAGDPVRPRHPSPSRVLALVTLPVAIVATGAELGLLPRVGALGVLVTVAVGLLADAVVTAARRRAAGPVRLLVIGSPESISGAIDRWTGCCEALVAGGLILDEQPGLAEFDAFGENRRASDGIPLGRISKPEDVPAWSERWAAETIVVLSDAGLGDQGLRHLGWLLEHSGCTLAVSGVIDSVAPHRVGVRRLGGTTLLEAGSSVPPVLERAAKWGVDRVVGVALLALVAPLLLLCCLLIRIDSKGPGLFRQIRVGRDARPFRMIKLRTMTTDAESMLATITMHDDGNGVLFKSRHDPRVTRLGRWLRRTSFDELPQLINVARGEMSLVGPRPALPSEVEDYDDATHRRYAVRPGMTGLWQVSGRSDLSWQESKELDLYYVDNYRASGDLAIGLRTIGAVVSSKGAY